MFSFLKSFIGVKGKEVGQEIVQALVELDPEGATAAQLDQMERDLDKAGEVLQKIRADYDREVREAEAAEKRYNQLMGAAEVLQGKLAAPGADTAAVEASLAKLVAQLEELAPEVEREKQDVVEIKALLDDAQAAYKQKAEAIMKARQQLERAKRDMQRATMEQERAEEKARRAAEVAGLRSAEGGGSKLNVALDSMQRRAEEARAKAAASQMKAQTLSTVAKPNEEDPLIAEALRQAQTGSSQAGSLSERLAALKKS